MLDGKTLLQASELKNAQLLADRLVSAVGDCGAPPPACFSLFVNAYDQARKR